MGELDRSNRVTPLDLRRLAPGRAIVHLKSWNPASSPALAPIERGDVRVLALGPGEWLLMSDSMDGADLHASVAASAVAQGIAAIDLSDGLAGLELEGTAAPDVLATACGLDLHPNAFAAGACTRTRLAQLRVVIACTRSAPTYELHVGTSYLPYLESWLTDAISVFAT
jgi:sarcosine oxidase subunit gamma